MQASQHRANELQISIPSPPAATKPLDHFGAEDSVAFQAAGDFATEREHRFGRLSFERVANGVVADRSDAFRQRSIATLGTGPCPTLRNHWAGRERPSADTTRELRFGL